MLIKLITLVDIIIELFMFVYEVWRLHNLEKARVDVIVRYSEEKRRETFGTKYLKVSISSISVVLVACLIMHVSIPARDCENG